MIKHILLFFLIPFNAISVEIIDSFADQNDETIVFSEAAQPNGSFNQILLEQPQDAQNPLGNPIDYLSSGAPKIFTSQNTGTLIQQKNLPSSNNITEISPQNPSVSQMSPQAVGKEIQNKLYQSGDRIYDVQSYPANDINYINQNNQDNAVTNYPAY